MQIHENKENGDRCHCCTLDLYISKLPLEAREKDLFYVCPVERLNKKKNTFDSSVWYYSIPIGRNKLSQMVPEMCKLGEIYGQKTNCSLRARGATELYEAEVPEKIIQERTGHRSLDSLRIYERTSEKQQQAVTNILSSTSETNYHTQLARLDSNSHNVTVCPSTSNVSLVAFLPNFNFISTMTMSRFSRTVTIFSLLSLPVGRTVCYSVCPAGSVCGAC